MSKVFLYKHLTKFSRYEAGATGLNLESQRRHAQKRVSREYSQLTLFVVYFESNFYDDAIFKVYFSR